MRQAILYGARDLRIEDVPLDSASLQSNEIYVETEVSALSTGTDLGNYLGDSTYVPGAPTYPRWIGYSNVGVVRKVGSLVKKFTTGQRVFSGNAHQSAYVAKHDEMLIPVPDSVSSEEASLANLTLLGLTALRQAKYETGENVIVVGLGVIGLCTIWLANAMGAKVLGISNSNLRSDLARRLGAAATLLSDEENPSQKVRDALGEAGADIVILTANTWSAYRTSMDIVRFGGRVSLLGFPGRAQSPPNFNPLDPTWLYGKQLALFGVGFPPQVDCSPSDIRFTRERNLLYILDLMGRHTPRLSTVISHQFPADRMQEAYELAHEHSKSLVAAVFDWRLSS
jgi:threonine dehydrogenase-like Zn-dependent dehydrogenase